MATRPAVNSKQSTGSANFEQCTLHFSAALNVTFAVHPTAYVVHVPHERAPTYHFTVGSGQWDKVGAPRWCSARLFLLACALPVCSLQDSCWPIPTCPRAPVLCCSSRRS